MSASDSEEEPVSATASDADDDSSFDEDDEVCVVDDDDEDDPVVLSQAEIKARNVQAMISGSLQVTRKPMVTGLKCQDVAAVLAAPFRAPFAGASVGHSAELARRLASRRRFVPWGSNVNVATLSRPVGAGAFASPLNPKPEEPAEEPLPPGVEPLVLWEDAEGGANPPVSVDNMLCRWLRPHQREGVKFMFECVMGLRDFDGKGCILADDMGLGKTLQGITLLWTLLCQGLDGTPTAKRALIVCPTSLVSNWDDECNKWLKGRVKTLPICESSRADVISSVNRFLSPRNTAQVMIVSYETFRIHAERFAKDPASCDLVICDEAHRLKNGETLTNKALGSVPCLRRVMLSGTPMQNHLDEFFSMVNFCNPGLLGTPSEFHKHYERPILAGREPDASESELELAKDRNAELSELVNKFVLRRTNTILSKHLPPKVVEVVCCRMSPLQSQLYRHFLESKAAKAALTGKHTMVLAAITALKKLCNHPKLIYDMIHGAKNTGQGAAGFESCGEFFQPGMYDVRGGGRGSGGMVDGWEFHSGKFAVLARLLAILRAETKDRVVIISNYTQTLDLVQLLCRQCNYPAVRLDGGTSITKRQKLVKQFNDPTSNSFVFLLSSKAGGCGINLIGGNRLVLFDPDWNPANDKQAAARCWRDGQKKKCYLYRLFATGSIEEKVFQRQLSKESLQNVVNGEGTLEQSSMSKEELRRLFTLDEDTVSDTHDGLGCEKCPGKEFEGHHGSADAGLWEEQADDADEQKLETWGHHHTPENIPDPIMRRAAGDDVSFVFSLQVDGCAIVEDPSKKERKSVPGAAAPKAAPPPASGAGAVAGYRLGAAAGGRTTTTGAAGTGTLARPAIGAAAGSRRPRTTMTANRPTTTTTAATTAARTAAAAKPAPKKTAPAKKPPAAKKKAKHSDSEEEEDSEFADTESEEEEEEDAEDDDDDEEEEEEEDASESESEEEDAAAAAAARAKRSVAKPRSDATRPKPAARRRAAISDSEDESSEDEPSDEDSDGLGDDDAVADSEDDADADPDGDPPAPRLAPAKRPRPPATVNRASVNVPDAETPAGLEVDAKRGRKSEGMDSVDLASSPSELAMGSPDDSDSDFD